MLAKLDQPLDELIVQVWLLYDHPNFKYCTLNESRTESPMDKQTDGQTDDPNSRSPKKKMGVWILEDSTVTPTFPLISHFLNFLFKASEQLPSPVFPYVGQQFKLTKHKLSLCNYYGTAAVSSFPLCWPAVQTDKTQIITVQLLWNSCRLWFSLM